MSHPSIHLEIARQRRRELLDLAAQHRVAQAAQADGHGESPREPSRLHEPAPTTANHDPQGAKA